MLGLLDSEHVAHELDHGVLKAAAGAEQRYLPLARDSDRLESAVHVPVGTARRDQQPGVGGELAVVHLHRCLGRQPLEAKRRPNGVLERLLRSLVRRPLGAVVADDGDRELLASIRCAHDSSTPTTRADLKRI